MLQTNCVCETTEEERCETTEKESSTTVGGGRGLEGLYIGTYTVIHTVVHKVKPAQQSTAGHERYKAKSPQTAVFAQQACTPRPDKMLALQRLLRWAPAGSVQYNRKQKPLAGWLRNFIYGQAGAGIVARVASRRRPCSKGHRSWQRHCRQRRATQGTSAQPLLPTQNPCLEHSNLSQNKALGGASHAT